MQIKFKVPKNASKNDKTGKKILLSIKKSYLF